MDCTLLMSCVYMLTSWVCILGEANETDQRSRYVGLCGLFVFYYRLFKPNLDKKFFKTLYQVHKKVHTPTPTHTHTHTHAHSDASYACRCGSTMPVPCRRGPQTPVGAVVAGGRPI